MRQRGSARPSANCQKQKQTTGIKQSHTNKDPAGGKNTTGKGDRSTRNAIFSAHLREELLGGASAAGLYVLIPLPDGFDGLPIIGLFPFEIRVQCVVQCVGNVLSRGFLLHRLAGHFVLARAVGAGFKQRGKHLAQFIGSLFGEHAGQPR